jgi:hypothetical protein
MRTLLRYMATGHYFQSLERWTMDRDEAYDFGFISKAVKVAQKLRIRDLELVLAFDNPEQAAGTPFEKHVRGLPHTRKYQAAGRRAPRRVVLA